MHKISAKLILSWTITDPVPHLQNLQQRRQDRQQSESFPVTKKTKNKASGSYHTGQMGHMTQLLPCGESSKPLKRNELFK